MSRVDAVAVNIVDVVPGTVRVTARELRAGDVVFDAMGGEYKLTEVRPLKRSVRTTRKDGLREWWAPDATITVRRTV